MALHVAHRSLPLIVLVLSLAASESDSQIDPEHVRSLEDMDGERVALGVFVYDPADSRGWPASPGDRQFVRFLQDSGVDVAFRFDEASGLHHGFVFGSQVNKFLVLRQIAQEKGIPVPEMPPEVVVVRAEPPDGEAKVELPWWLNAMILAGTIAALFWVFAVRDRPT